MAIGEEGLRHLRALARLEMPQEEAASVEHDLSRVLSYFETLSELDTTGVEPLVRPVAVARELRDDEPRPSLPRQDALASGRADDDGRFVVPRTVDEGN